MPRTPRHHVNLVVPRDVSHTQNFLTSRQLVERLVTRAQIGPDDLVLEIGPGRGIITEVLARRAGRVIAIEKDRALAAALGRRFIENPNVTIQAADFLNVSLPREPFKVFASLPFNATSEIVGKLLTAPCPPEDLHLVVQREAAERFSGRPRESLVAVLLKPWFEPSIVHRFQRHDFAPAPRVDVVMLRLHKRGPPLVDSADARLFRDFVSYGFTAWRPSVISALEHLVGRLRARQVAHEVGLALDAPPSQVRFELWLRLFQALRASDRSGLASRLAGSEQRLRLQQRTLPKIHRTRSGWTRRPPPRRLTPQLG
jgi:23S rRNA (adenine-N6)-dimethyltransferase